VARLPSDRYLFQVIGSKAVLFEDYTEVEIASFDPASKSDLQQVVATIADSTVLPPEDKYWACVWAGYFYAHHPAR
jgi:hypothetical protein